MTTFAYTAIDWITVAAITLLLIVEVIRTTHRRRHRSQGPALTVITVSAYITTAFMVVAAMIDQAVHYPESMHLGPLLCGVASAAYAMVRGLYALVPALAASSHDGEQSN
ncbi:hypothetical protein [Mycolicibacterium llatzerense]|uniref:hypothetical protein n=1 Tax=Mycolicibacterium llatzerense TaxID=280871 RepID=UPI0021B6DDE6|nr:hypothetical protein [Mycolicibacterium llatzerense]MCT7371932.1 hypothetical protein [Mycolicibacterium llatzerense]